MRASHVVYTLDRHDLDMTITNNSAIIMAKFISPSDSFSELLLYLRDNCSNDVLEDAIQSAIRWTRSRLDRMRWYFETSDFTVQHLSSQDLERFLEHSPLILLSSILLALLALVLLVYACLSRRRRCPGQPSGDPRLRAPLNALLSFLTPTFSIWPPLYLRVAQLGITDNTAALRLPLATFLDDVISGVVELRNPVVDLPAFVTSTLSPHGWKVVPHIALSWYISVAVSTVRLRLAPVNPFTRKKPLRLSGTSNICVFLILFSSVPVIYDGGVALRSLLS